MAREQHEYDDIPGTFVFDAERSRQGYGINMFCMSLMKDENRQAFKANEAEYLKQFKLTPEQADAVLKRDYNRMLELGGNIYFTAKLGATDGHSFQHLAATMTGSTQQDYADMMLGGGRSVEGNRSRTGKNKPSAFLSGGEAKSGQKKHGERRGEEESRRHAESQKQTEIQSSKTQSSKTQDSKTEVGRGQNHRRRRFIARARHRRGARQRQDRGAVLETGIFGLREIARVDARNQARCGDHRL